MRIEKYHAEDMQEAFRLIKADLGSDAVVIQTRKVRLGVLGWFKKPVYEVIAAVDEDAVRPPKLASAMAAGSARTAARSAAGAARSVGVRGAAPTAPPVAPKPARAQAAAYAAAPSKPVFQPLSPLQTNGSASTAEAPVAAKTDTRPADGDSPVKLESSDVALLREMKSNMSELKTAMNRLSKQTQFGNIANFSAALVDVYQRLVDQELAEDLAQDIILRVNGELGSNGVTNVDLVRDYVRRHIQGLIEVTWPP